MRVPYSFKALWAFICHWHQGPTAVCEAYAKMRHPLRVITCGIDMASGPDQSVMAAFVVPAQAETNAIEMRIAALAETTDRVIAENVELRKQLQTIIGEHTQMHKALRRICTTADGQRYSASVTAIMHQCAREGLGDIPNWTYIPAK